MELTSGGEQKSHLLSRGEAVCLGEAGEGDTFLVVEQAVGGIVPVMAAGCAAGQVGWHSVWPRRDEPQCLWETYNNLHLQYTLTIIMQCIYD